MKIPVVIENAEHLGPLGQIDKGEIQGKLYM